MMCVCGDHDEQCAKPLESGVSVGQVGWV